jgi:hypothetical protein
MRRKPARNEFAGIIELATISKDCTALRFNTERPLMNLRRLGLPFSDLDVPLFFQPGKRLLLSSRVRFDKIDQPLPVL